MAIKRKNPRRSIRIGLIASLVVLLAVIVIKGNNVNFASLAYPPIPEDHYAYINDAAAFCNIPKNHRGLLAALAWKESTFHADSQSGAGAIGVTQVLRGTALGVANQHQISGFNTQSIFDPAINYKIGACYLADKVHDLGDGTDADWDNPTIVKGALVAYNAGPARGASFVNGSYNGPLSSLGYADRIMQAEQVYGLDIHNHDLQNVAPQPNLLNDIRGGLWKLLIGQSS